jgi:hypothetical protein
LRENAKRPARNARGEAIHLYCEKVRISGNFSGLLDKPYSRDRVDNKALVSLGEIIGGYTGLDNRKRGLFSISGASETRDPDFNKIDHLNVEVSNSRVQLPDNGENKLIIPVRQPVFHPIAPTVSVARQRPGLLIQKNFLIVSIPDGIAEISSAVVIIECNSGQKYFAVSDGVST